MEREELSKFLTAVGVTFQHGALFGSRTIGENVAAPLQEHTDLSDTLIESLVELKLGMVSMADAIHRMPGELSGGMQKRAAIARALALDPRILFFDEPSAGLDPVTAASLDELIVYLNRSLECTIVVITHEMQSCLRIADRIVFLHDGRVTETGTKEEITRSSNPRIQRFLQASGAD
jgi:phospholipid/cholesterol/gamma-HCH transport system ATP-binding protein